MPSKKKQQKKEEDAFDRLRKFFKSLSANENALKQTKRRMKKRGL